MRILFTFENALPSVEADAEVFVTTATYLAPLVDEAWLHVPLPRDADVHASGLLNGVTVVRARAPLRPAAFRHFWCGIALVTTPEFRHADLVYTRNLWVAFMALLFGQKVVFDHYRPWPEQIPPLQWWIHRLLCHPRFLINICHSEYTRRVYASLGVPAGKLQTIRNGFEPRRLQAPPTPAAAKAVIGVPADRKTVVYIGRLNHKKGLDLAIAAAERLPEILFILVGSRGEGPIEEAARRFANIRVVAWQRSEDVGQYIFAADVLLIPPSRQPLEKFGSTVLPLKLFLYMASGRAIVAGATDDVQEVLRHRENAYLCMPDSVESLVAGLQLVTQDAGLAARLGAAAFMDSRDLTWETRAQHIADAIKSRLRSRETASPHWKGAQYRSWLRQSRQWLVHLATHRSWVMPPATAAATPELAGES